MARHNTFSSYNSTSNSTNDSTTMSFRHRLKDFWRTLRNDERFERIRAFLPPLNFITVHYTYFITTCLITSVIFWGTSDPAKSISYTDSLFLVVSAMTEAGLNTVNLSQMTLFQQILLWVLIVMGSSILVSISTVLIRKRVFETRFKNIVRRQKELGRQRQGRRRSTSMSAASTRDREGVMPGMEERLGAGEKESGMSGSGEKLEVDEKEKVTDQQLDEGNDGAKASDLHPGPSEHVFVGSLGRDGKKTPLREINFDLPFSKDESTSTAGDKPSVEDEGPPRTARRRSSTADVDRISPMLNSPSPGEPSRVINFVGVGSHPNSTSVYKQPNTSGLINRGERKARQIGNKVRDVAYLDYAQYPSYLTRHTTGRNGQFYGLTRAEREHLGGVEYRAISLLAWVVPAYFILWQSLGCIGLGAYMAANKASTTEENGINPWWLGIFNGASAFNNSGMSLLDANMIPFQTSVYTLVTMGLMILAGNTAYPLFLRLILWSMLQILCLLFPDPEKHTQHKATLRFILRFPRRVYTNLFPSAPTWWLLFMLVVLNGTDWAAFELLNIGNAATNAIPKNYRVLDGLFQALAVRSGGFYVIDISSLRIGLQVLYVIMMYISAYPVVITMRHSNVYEERSLGIYADDSTAASSDSDEEAAVGHPAHTSTSDLPKLGTLTTKFRRTLTLTINNISTPFISTTIQPTKPEKVGSQFVREQIRGQLAHDLWLLVLAVLFISCIEVGNFDRDPVTYSVFNIIFEVVTAYGCVGISTGLPNEAYSFSGGWHKASKLILCVVMLRGRHRGLPVALDRAVRLPGQEEKEGEREEEDRVLRRSLSMSRRGSFVNSFALGDGGGMEMGMGMGMMR